MTEYEWEYEYFIRVRIHEFFFYSNTQLW